MGRRDWFDVVIKPLPAKKIKSLPTKKFEEVFEEVGQGADRKQRATNKGKNRKATRRLRRGRSKSGG
jgi:mRNA-degrading endonuclease RelE of RelBE toxin-antitoxin system